MKPLTEYIKPALGTLAFAALVGGYYWWEHRPHREKPETTGTAVVVVAGHTDAAGGEEYNQSLSERRADAIKKYLIEKYGINGSDLVTVGYGKSKLKDPSQPMAEANRRVQVVNMENKATASK